MESRASEARAMLTKRRIALRAAIVCCLSLPASEAAITVIDYYRLGEGDPGAVDQAIGNIITVDQGDPVFGANALVRNGSPQYVGTQGSTAADKLGSILSMFFSAGGSYSDSGVSTLATDNFGIEGWFKPRDTTTAQVLVYNGARAASGFGLYLLDGTYHGSYGGVAFIDSGVPAQAGVWSYFAMVRDGGSTQLYVNGLTPVRIEPNLGPKLGTIGDPFVIGAHASSVDQFTGQADEVRLFEFAPGTFNAETDLLFAIPEPSVAATFFAGLCLCGNGRRARHPPGQ